MMYEVNEKIDEFVRSVLKNKVDEPVANNFMLSILLIGFTLLEGLGYTIYHYYAQNDDSVSVFLLRYHGKLLGSPIIGRAHNLYDCLDYAYTAATFHNLLDRGHTEKTIMDKLGLDDAKLENMYGWLRGRKAFGSTIDNLVEYCTNDVMTTEALEALYRSAERPRFL